jgi:hypothetical protein
MGARLAEAKIPTTINPLGIAYHPLAVSRQVELALHDEAPEARERDGLWHAFDLHSRFNQLDEKTFREEVKQGLNAFKMAWEQATVVILTFGTAWAYRRNDNQELVSNCHKYPGSFFTKELLSVEAIVKKWSTLIQQFPAKKFLLTVSPVRHTKDRLPMNSVSKATLRLATHALVESLPNAYYFPSFEIMMDDLRGYRYFGQDLIHPNNMAEEYIWSVFSDSFFSTKTQQLIHKWGKVQSSLQHRPFQQDSLVHQQFLAKLDQQLADLSTEMDVEKELKELRLLQKK